MKVLSLFDGMACGHIAFNQLGVSVDRYVAYEVDKYATKVALHNFPDIEQRGDVFDANFTEFEGFDWLVGGSPCTYWSIAQKNNRETEASGLGWELFSQYVRALHEAKPKMFLYENNKSMSKEIKASITKTFGFEPICINSALVSAQNRNRLYWVGVRQEDGSYRKADIQQPEDRGILLRDFLSIAIAQRGRRDKNGIIEQRFEPREDGKTNVLTTVSKDNMVAEPIQTDSCGKSRPLQASYFKYAASDSFKETNPRSGVAELVAPICEPVRVGSLPRPNGELSQSQGFRIYSQDGKSVNLTAQGGGVGAKTGLYAIPFDDKTEKKYPVYEVRNGQITIKDKQYPIKLVDGYYIIRKLTVAECKRLQTVPDWYDMSVISNSQAYKCLGNGWTIAIIMHLVKSATNNKKSEG